jgi:cytochrome b6-f complex iron-sulfur subunit
MNIQPNQLTHQKTNDEMTRRRFLKKSSTLAAGTCVVTIIGCSSEDDPGLIQSLLKEQTSTKEPVGEETPVTDPVAGAPKGPSVKMSNQLKKVGGNQKVTDKAVLKALGVKETILLVRVDENTVYANTINCTHQGEPVKYDEDQRLLICPLHGSRFKLTGEVTKGPANRPLVHFKATIDGDMVALENL